MTMSSEVPYASHNRHPELVEQLMTHSAEQTFSFLELVLYATEFTEDEMEVADLVDAMFDSDSFPLHDMRDDQIAIA
jgi:hypothetical protein